MLGGAAAEGGGGEEGGGDQLDGAPQGGLEEKVLGLVEKTAFQAFDLTRAAGALAGEGTDGAKVLGGAAKRVLTGMAGFGGQAGKKNQDLGF